MKGDYPTQIGQIVICPESGCVGCEHAVKHKYMEVDSSCDGDEDGEHDCPKCELVN
jgi:hypothetical protein